MGKEEKKRLTFCLFLLILFTITFVNFKGIFYAPELPSSNLQLVVEGAEKWYESMLMFPKIVKAVHQGAWSVSKENSLDNLYLADCWRDTDWFRMYADPYCTFLWLREVEHETVSKLDLILSVVTNAEQKIGIDGVKSNQNGGMRCHFTDFAKTLDLKAYWKPCTDSHLPSNTETFQSEVIAFYVDQILAFHRTPVVVPRYFNYSQLLSLGYEALNRENNKDEDAIVKLRSIVDRCGSDNHNGAEGAMVGWSNFPIVSLDKNNINKDKRSNNRIRKEKMINMFKLDEEKIMEVYNDFQITRNSTEERITWVLENVAVNMFAVLMGNSKKFEHSVFMLSRPRVRNNLNPNANNVLNTVEDDDVEYGPFSYIDNDRSSWYSDFIKAEKLTHHPLTYFCKFPLKTATHLLLLKPSNSSSLSLGKLVMETASVYSDMKNAPLFTETNSYWLDHRAKFLTDTIENCIHRYGIENVLIPEPWLKDYSHIHQLSSLLSRLW